MKKHKQYILALLVVAFCAMPQSLLAQSEKQVNNEYHDNIIEYIKQDLIKKQKTMSKLAERTLVNLPNEYKLYDETLVDISLDVQEAEKEDGVMEMNLVYSISYHNSNIEGESDDYPAGRYAWDQSNSCRALCNLTKMFMEGDLREYIGNHDISVVIHANTDSLNIKKMAYGGEYGDFRYIPVTFNGENVRISVSQAEGITNNAQLGFIRAQSVRNFLETNIAALKRDGTRFDFVATNHPREGGQYRRSSIEIVIHGAFDQKAKEMILKLKDDEFVDYNLPKAEPESNKNTFVIIIANEDYPRPIPSVPFASNDGNIFYKYCVQTLGIPERHIKLLNNATREEIRDGAIHWVKDITVAVKGEANILIYYAGHGITDGDFKPYIMPTNLTLKKIKSIQKNTIGKDPIELSGSETRRLLAECISIDSICLWFNKVLARGITLIVDASFDGNQRNGQPFFGPRITSKKIKALRIRNDILVFSSSEYNKTSYSYDAQHHGFFTYYMLKELKRTAGDITLRALYDNINTNLSYESSLQGKLQQPTLVAGGKLKDSWEGIKLK